jgi:hypothetical protein
MKHQRWRVVAFVGLCLVCLIGTGVYAALAAHQAAVGAERASFPTAAPGPAARPGTESPYLLFESTAIDVNYGKLATVPLDDPTAPRTMTSLSCERVAFAAGAGLCLNAQRGAVTTYTAIGFDATFHPRFDLPLAGQPSRARVSPNGLDAAMTAFVAGDGYTAVTFSTRTTIVDLTTGASLGDLEQYSVTRDGVPFKAVDFNFWGVTFANDNRHFYATLQSAGKTFLIQGDLQTRSATVLRENVECPSLSPDNTRLAFKERVRPGSQPWRLTVLNLATMTETPLAETRSVDDQVEWLDDSHILYAVPTAGGSAPTTSDVWEVPADGSGSPAVFLAGASSPVVVR